jgi:hypothetical protein
MDQEQLWQELKALPPQAQREVIDFIAFLRRRYQLSGIGGKSKPKLVDEAFIGMWRNRKDMADSSYWVRNIRKLEWERR